MRRKHCQNLLVLFGLLPFSLPGFLRAEGEVPVEFKAYYEHNPQILQVANIHNGKNFGIGCDQAGSLTALDYDWQHGHHILTLNNARTLVNHYPLIPGTNTDTKLTLSSNGRFAAFTSVNHVANRQHLTIIETAANKILFDKDLSTDKRYYFNELEFAADNSTVIVSYHPNATQTTDIRYIQHSLDLADLKETVTFLADGVIARKQFGGQTHLTVRMTDITIATDSGILARLPVPGAPISGSFGFSPTGRFARYREAGNTMLGTIMNNHLLEINSPYAMPKLAAPRRIERLLLETIAFSATDYFVIRVGSKDAIAVDPDTNETLQLTGSQNDVAGNSGAFITPTLCARDKFLAIGYGKQIITYDLAGAFRYQFPLELSAEEIYQQMASPKINKWLPAYYALIHDAEKLSSLKHSKYSEPLNKAKGLMRLQNLVGVEGLDADDEAARLANMKTFEEQLIKMPPQESMHMLELLKNFRDQTQNAHLRALLDRQMFPRYRSIKRRNDLLAYLLQESTP